MTNYERDLKFNVNCFLIQTSLKTITGKLWQTRQIVNSFSVDKLPK